MTDEPRGTSLIGFRLDDADRMLVIKAAEREGLQLSSFFLFLLVRCGILPKSRLMKLKRLMVANYKPLHRLLMVVNNIAGLCKQLVGKVENDEGLEATQIALVRAAASITDCLKGKPVADIERIIRIKAFLTINGQALNQAVKAVHSGKNYITGLTEFLVVIRLTANSIAHDLGDGSESETLTDMAMAEMRANMRKAADETTKRQDD